MNNHYRILIIEDDEDISMVEQVYLENSGYETCVRRDGEHVSELLSAERFDLILLDVMLPKKNGFEICREIREIYSMPILMVTARTESLDKIRGLMIGADDYITKPFDPAELVARVGANIRQYERGAASGSESGADDLVVGSLLIQKKARKVFRDGMEIKLPNKEYEILLFLAENPNVAYTKEYLFEKIWGFDYLSDSATVMVHINRIREKIEEDPRNPKIIETVRGVGYRLCPDSPAV